MFKKAKLLGIAVASLGCVISIGSAVALYTKAANDASFGFSAGTYTPSTGVLQYTLNGANSPTISPAFYKKDGTNGGEGLSNDYPQIKYEATLGGTFASGLNAQQFINGKLSIKFSDVASDVQNNIKVYAMIDGYIETIHDEGKSDEHSYGYDNYRVLINNETFTKSSLDFSKEVTVETAGTQKLVIWVKFAESDTTYLSIDNLAKNEAALPFGLSITWEAASATYAPSVVGEFNEWAVTNDTEMQVNINKRSSEGKEFVYWNLTGKTGKAKCKDSAGTWSSGDDEVLDSAKVYNVYWSGDGKNAAYFHDVTPAA